MASPDPTLYRQLQSGFYMQKTDDTGPYVWDGTTMRLLAWKAAADGAADQDVAITNASLVVVGAAADGAAASGNPVQIGGKDGSGNIQAFLTDTNGVIQNNLYGNIAGEDITNDVLKVEIRDTGTYISTAATTLIKTGQGRLSKVTVQGGTAGTIILYDNTAGSGTILASFDSTNALETYLFDIQFLTGLTVVTSAATKLTVTWR